MSKKLLFNCTYGADNAERATLPFVAANIAAMTGQDVAVLCTIDAVWLGTTGGVDTVVAPGYPVLAELYTEFVANGGEVWLCGACVKPRNIDEAQLAPGAKIVGAAAVIEELLNGAQAIAFA